MAMTRPSNPAVRGALMPKALDCAEGYRRSSIGTVLRADFSENARRDRDQAHPTATTAQSANPRESSGAGGPRQRCSRVDIPRTTVHRSTARPVHNTLPEDRG